MNPQRFVGVLYAAIQIGCYALLPGTLPVTIAAGMILVVATLLPERMRLRGRAHLVTLAVLSLIYLVGGLGSVLGGTELIVLLRQFGCYLLLVLCLELIRIDRGSQWNYLPGLGCMTYVLALLSSYPEDRSTWFDYLPLLQASVLLLVLRPDLPWIVARGSTHPGKARVLLLLIFFCLLIGQLFQTEVRRDLVLLRQSMGDLSVERAVERVRANSNARFVQSIELSRLGIASRGNPEQVVFSVESNAIPGYLRTLSFSQFDGRKWSNPNEGKVSVGQSPIDLGTLAFASSEALLRDTRNFPGTMSALSARRNVLDKMVIQVLEGHGSLVPIPTSAVALKGTPNRGRQLRLDPHGNVLPGSIRNDRYCVLLGPDDNSDSPTNRSASTLLDFKALPGADREFLVSLANSICGDAGQGEARFESDTRQILAFFQNNFEYSLDMQDISEDSSTSRLRRFLENRLPAHCEFFASAAVLLLRARGHASRLSTGYLVFEQNDETDEFEAKNKGAHAWAEALHPDTRAWTIVEATPTFDELVRGWEADRNGSELRLANNSATDSWFTLERVLETARWMWSILLDSTRSRFAWLLPIPLLILAANIYYHRGSRRNKDRILSPHVRRADRRARKLGVTRRPDETCLQIALRLRETATREADILASWYEQHSESWYKQN